MSAAAVPSLFADYRGMADSVADKLVGYSKDDGGWRVAKSNKLVTISWRASTEFPGYLYKGEGLLEMAPNALWEFVKPTPDGLRVKWDRNVRAFQILQSLDEELSVCRTITSSAAMGVISARDFVDVVLVKRYDDGSIASNATHVVHESCPPQSGYVRGFNHPCGCMCLPVPGEPNKTKMVTFFQTDLGGYLPRSLVDSFFPSTMAEFYSNLSKALTTLKP
ncbi:stAR-related lipid transfer protein 5 [Lethenteron reissneri]|uniref:stAR-related lipid transfer protein 5 n=1 Tax=Lethenteron reissneri TaxID=7753 RepID=UPI002AB72690|nr:stAR-related lipid transfer protein 5 [Lethenteron reissneri]